MRIERENVQAIYDGTPLSVLKVYPDGAPKMILVIHHGMCEHKERYLWLMKEFAKSGIFCIMADMRGHGESVRKKKDLGYFYGSKAEGLILDLHQIIYIAREEYPLLPVVLLGHSMGSLVARCYTARHDFHLDGLILSGAPCANPAVGAGLSLVKFLKCIKGGHSRSRFVTNLAMGAYDKPFAEEGIKNAWLAADPNVAKEFNRDPLCGIPFTLDGYEALMSLLKMAYDPSAWKPTKPQMPILFLGGEDDPVLGGKKGFRHSIHFLKHNVGYEHVTGHLFSGNRHEIFNDVSKEQAVRCVKKWLETHELTI